ncbi:hypothetical protein JCM5353_008048 [Sporobolomyces roseus]
MSSNTPDLAPPPRSTHLPTELLSQIILDPTLSTSDLVHLCQTSRQLLHPARQALYRHLHVRMKHEEFDSIPSYRLRGTGRMCCDKRTLSLIRTLRKSPEIGSLARSIEIGRPMSPSYDLTDFQCAHHSEGVNKLLNLVPNVISLKNSSSHGCWLVDDTFLTQNPSVVELEIASHWAHSSIEEGSSLVNLRKLRIESFLYTPSPECSISTAPPFQNLRILDIGTWDMGAQIIKLPARIVPNLHVLRTSYASLRSYMGGKDGKVLIEDERERVQFQSGRSQRKDRRFRSMIPRHFPWCRSSSSLINRLPILAIPALPLSRRR